MSRRFGEYLRQHHLVLILIFVALGGTAIAAGERGLQNDAINACVKKKSNALSLAKNGKCPKKAKPISWNQAGPQGPAGQNGTSGTNGVDGAPGAAGADGTARAYGIVQPNGLLTSSKNATATRASVGVYCISVPGVSSASTPIVLTTDQSTGTAPGVADWDGPAVGNIMDGTPSRHTEAQFDGAGNDTCSAGQFEIETFRTFFDPNSDNASAHDIVDAGFSFVVP